MNQDEKYHLLKERFGHNDFRSKQEEAVDCILEGRDLLMVLPTGGGKSLAFQLPTLMMPGTTVVISPLIALMQDQVHALNAQKMDAEMLSSMQSREESEMIINDLIYGNVKFLYLSPERLNTPRMQQILSQIDINFFVIDEAHCISEWGHEFREDYRALSQLRKRFPMISIAAFTATATHHVRDDILRLLCLNNPKTLQGVIFRENLKISVKHRNSEGKEQLLNFLKSYPQQSGIIYTSSRKKTESLSQYLNTQGFKSLAYHAGLPHNERSDVYHAFVYDEIHIVVATIAFGMGIDKSNIRFVVHMNLPKTVENYYQEMGRAGRDGDNSEVLLLYSAADMIQQKHFIDQVNDPTYSAHMHDKLNAIYRYASSETCRHQMIAKYFEDTIDTCEKHCDNCSEDKKERTDISIQAQKILSAIYKTSQMFGKNYIIDILRGSKEQKILANTHDKLSVYGIGEEMSKKQWFVIVDRLLEVGAIGLNEHKGLILLNEGILILKGKSTLKIDATRLHVRPSKIKKVIEEVFDFNSDLFEKLRILRGVIAKENSVPAYIVFGDKTLKEMARDVPQNNEEMLAINGVGAKKLEQYGEQFIALLTSKT
ncbi:MAG: DNA helicase RecQ [Campylobacterota bacterium]|nr:DNA helicase RecQ [Campylobacterota bacterium]